MIVFWRILCCRRSFNVGSLVERATAVEGDQVFLAPADGGCGGERGLAKLLMIKDGWRLQNGWGLEGHRALEGGQFVFGQIWKFRFMYTWGMYGHFFVFCVFFFVKSAVFHQITKLFQGKCARNQSLVIKWIKIALEYCNIAWISSLEQKKQAIFNVKYENVLHTPYSKARGGVGWVYLQSKNVCCRFWTFNFKQVFLSMKL